MDTNSFALTKMSKLGLQIMLWALGISLVLFIPFLPLGMIASKGIILTTAAFLGTILWLLDAITVGRFAFPRGRLIYVLLLSIVATAAITFFLPNKTNSILGTGFDFGTVASLAIAFIYLFLISLWGQGYNFISKIIKTIYLTGIIALVFSTINIFVPYVAKFPKFFISLTNSNLIGTYNDMAIFLAGFVILITITLEKNFWNKPMKIWSLVFMGLSLFYLFIFNYTFVWFILGMVGLSLFIYKLMPTQNIDKNTIDGSENQTIKRSFSKFAFIILICSFVAIVGARNIAKLVSGKPFYFTNSEPRPTLVSSIKIIKNSYWHNPVTSIGPNRYNQTWESGKYKLSGGQFFKTQYWNASFNKSIGLFFTLITTIGAVGSLLLIYFVILFILKYFSIFNFDFVNKSKSRELTIYAALVAYTFVLFLFDNPNNALFISSVALWGMFISYINTIKEKSPKLFVFINDPRHSFFGILGVIVMMVAVALGFLSIFGSIYSGYLVNKASLEQLNEQGLAQAEYYIQKAISINPLDIYARSLSNINLLAINYALNDKTISQEKLTTLVQNRIKSAADSAKISIAYNPQNYQNYMALSAVNEMVLNFGDKSTYKDAITIIDKGLEYSPNNMTLIYKKAQIAVNAKDYDLAKEYINQIININPAISDSYLLLAQIDLVNGDTDAAYRQIDKAMTYNPSSASLPYQKGLLYFSKQDYSSAARMFEKAVSISPNYIDAYSSLALTYEKLGDRDSVIRTLETVKKYINDTTKVDELIATFSAGGSLTNQKIEETPKDEKEGDTKKTDKVQQ